MCSEDSQPPCGSLLHRCFFSFSLEDSSTFDLAHSCQSLGPLDASFCLSENLQLPSHSHTVLILSQPEFNAGTYSATKLAHLQLKPGWPFCNPNWEERSQPLLVWCCPEGISFCLNKLLKIKNKYKSGYVISDLPIGFRFQSKLFIIRPSPFSSASLSNPF